MNHYTQLLYFLKQLAESHPLVNTVTQGKAENIDLEKSNIFPLVHLTIEDAKFTNGKMLNFPVTIECLTERDFNKEVIDNKFWKQDNEVDNHNETLAILNYMWTSIYRDWNENNLTTTEDATVEKIEFARGNVLDGWSLSFEVEVPNTDLCLSLLPIPEYTLTTTVSAGGTLEQNPTGTTFNEGELVSFCAETDEGFAIDTLTVNGVATTSPFSIIFNENKVIILDFILGGLIQKLKTFITAPVLRGCKYFFGDYSANDNDVLVKNQRVGTFDSVTSIQGGLKMIGQSPILLEYIGTSLGLGSYIITSMGSISPSNKGIVYYINAGQHNIIISDGVNQDVWTFARYQVESIFKFTFNWSGLIGDVMTANLNGVSYTKTALYEWVGNSTSDVVIGRPPASIRGLCVYVKVNELIEYILNHGQGAIAYNLLDLTKNGTITGAVLSTFWGSTSDDAYPYDSILGATLYKNDSDSTIMPICVETNIVIPGFTRLIYLPPGSGISKGLANTYHISGVDAIIPEGDYTADEIGAFTPSANLELIQTEFAVTSLIVNE